MKNLATIIAAVLTVLLLQACNYITQHGGKKSIDAQQVSGDTSEMAASSSTIIYKAEKEDEQFVTAAASEALCEIELGKLARQKGINRRVKTFGALMVIDHSKVDGKLAKLAEVKNITLPTGLNANDKNIVDSLSAKTGKDFDAAYVNMMINSHKRIIKTYQDASRICKDPEINAFAIKNLPILKAHLDAINAVHDSMLAKPF